MGDSDADSFAEPAKVVRGFIADMHQWELETAVASAAAKKSDRYDAFTSATRKSLSKVFARWCTPKERSYGRCGSFQDPPEYQPDYEKILEVVLESSRRCSVYTQQGTGFKNKQKYVLLKKGNRWQIDSVKWQLNDGKWANGIL